MNKRFYHEAQPFWWNFVSLEPDDENECSQVVQHIASASPDRDT